MGLVQAYCGAPAEATAEEGEQSFAMLTEMLVELAARARPRAPGAGTRRACYGRV